MSEIRIEGVSKNYGSTRALKDVNLTLEENKIYGLLGRNGAGKTTLLNIINNRVFANEGTVKFDGNNAVEGQSVQSQLYFVGEKMLFPDSMKVNKAIKWTADFYPDFDQEYANHLAEIFELPQKSKIKALSTGYKSIFKNVLALSVNTPFVFLDEPVLGLDANHRELFYKLLIEKYIETPSTYVISTHLIEEVANIIEEVVIIKKGEIIKKESRDRLLGQGYSVSGAAAAVDRYANGRNVIGMDTLGGLKSAYILGTPDKDQAVGLEFSTLDLQKLFIQLTNSQEGMS